MKFIFLALTLFIAGCDKPQEGSATHATFRQRGKIFISDRVVDGRTQLIAEFPNGETQVLASETR